MIRASNPIESTFATVRLRTDKTKGCLSRQTALAMVFKLAKSAERHWRRLDGSERLAQVIEGVHRSGPRFWDRRLDWKVVGSVVLDGANDEQAEAKD